jgi:outer membrane protein TolC
MEKLWTVLMILAAALPARAQEVRLSPEQAVARALRHNLDLQIDRLAPVRSEAPEEAAKAAFDPVLFGSAQGAGTPGLAEGREARVETGVRKTFSTGTSVEARLGTSAVFGGRAGMDPFFQSGVTVNVRQPLLRGSSAEANEVLITTARLLRQAGQEELERRAETIAAETMRSYWDLHAALASAEVQRVALATAEKTLEETRVLVRSGKLAAAEEAAASYQVQAQRRGLVQAEQAVGNARDHLARLIGFVDPRSLATPALVTVAAPGLTPRGGIAQLQEAALARRGDYRAARTQVEARRAELGAARHQLLPSLDLVAGASLLGLSGEGSTRYDASYWASYGMKNFGWSVGVLLEIPLGNRAAEAKRDIAGLELRRAELSVERAAQVISEELNVAWRGVQSAKAALQATEAAAALADTKAQNELERYRAGRSTGQLLTLAQAEAVKERLAKEQAQADLQKAFVGLSAAAGSLIEQLGVKAS